MPNWVSNRLSLQGTNSEEILQSICTISEDTNELVIDFNKIIPMPKELNIISGGSTNNCVELYLASINPKVAYYEGSKVSQDEYDKILALINDSRNYGSFKGNLPQDKLIGLEKQLHTYLSDKELAGRTILEYGKTAVDNVLNHGSMTWYEWSLENWGSKWNATESCVYENEVFFNTAWSDVRLLAQALSTKYPELTIHYDFAEEEMALYCGSITYQGGEVIDGGDFDKFSKQAYEMHFDLWGENDDYVYDEQSDNYIYTDNENEM